jgi:hypothetical protein
MEMGWYEERTKGGLITSAVGPFLFSLQADQSPAVIHDAFVNDLFLLATSGRGINEIVPNGTTEISNPPSQ